MQHTVAHQQIKLLVNMDNRIAQRCGPQQQRQKHIGQRHVEMMSGQKYRQS